MRYIECDVCDNRAAEADWIRVHLPEGTMGPQELDVDVCSVTCLIAIGHELSGEEQDQVGPIELEHTGEVEQDPGMAEAPFQMPRVRIR